MWSVRLALVGSAVVLGFATPCVRAVAEGGDCPLSHGSTHVEGAGLAFEISGHEAQAPAHCRGDADPAGDGPYLQVGPRACELGGAAICNEKAADCNGQGGEWHVTVWIYPNGDTEHGPQVCVGGEQPPSPPQVTGVRVLQAFRQIPLPTPSLGTSPPDRVTLVNLPTIFYTEAAPFDRQMRVLGRRVALHIEPVSYDWSVGQGGEFRTDWPGSPYQHGVTPQQDPDAYVTWSYAHAEQGLPARVEVVWGATWSLDGKPMGRVPGTVSMTSPATSLTVREARGVLTAD